MANEAGAGAEDRGGWVANQTIVSEGCPATIAGNVVAIRGYFNVTNPITAYVAFFTASGNNLTTIAGTRTALSLPAQGSGVKEWTAPGDFAAFAVPLGAYLGLYCLDYQNYFATGGSGYWITDDDHTDADGYGFPLVEAGIDSLSADIQAASGGSIVPTLMDHYRRRRG